MVGDSAELLKGSEHLPEAGTLPTRKVYLRHVSRVTVLTVSGRVVNGHIRGWLSLWRVEDGMFEKKFKDERGSSASCIDVSDDESVAVSGRYNEFSLVWNAATWNCLFALEGHLLSADSATISADITQIVSAEWRGRFRVWDAENGTLLAAVESRLKCLRFVSRGPISGNGRYLFVRQPRPKVFQMHLSMKIPIGKRCSRTSTCEQAAARRGARSRGRDPALWKVTSAFAFASRVAPAAKVVADLEWRGGLWFSPAGGLRLAFSG